MRISRRGVLVLLVVAMLWGGAIAFERLADAPGEPEEAAPQPIPEAAYATEAYRAQISDYKAALELASRTLRAAPNKRVALRRGTGYRAAPGKLAAWRNQGETRCLDRIAIPCDHVQAPPGCRPGATCRARINELAPLTDVYPAAAKGEEAFARFTPFPYRNGAQGIGFQGELFHFNETCLVALCIRGEFGAGWDCRPTSEEVETLALMEPAGGAFYQNCLPRPADSDGDGVPDGIDICPAVPGQPPTGCPAAPAPRCGDGTCNGTETCSTCSRDCGECKPPPPPAGDLRTAIERTQELLTEAAAELDAILESDFDAGPNSTGKLENRLVSPLH